MSKLPHKLIIAVGLLCVPLQGVRANLVMSGVLEATVFDPVNPLTGIIEYKAIEFFTDTTIAAGTVGQYFLRRYQNVDGGVPAGTTDVFFDAVTVNPGFFYAVRDTVAFDHMYNLANVNGTWASRTGDATPQIVLADDGILDIFDGDEAFALGFQPSGGGGEILLDSYGYGETLGSQPPGSAWEYPNTYAYRNNLTARDGGNFDPANWTRGTTDEFFFNTTEYVVQETPFGTFLLPEPGTMGLLGLGFVLLLAFRRSVFVPRRN